MRALSTLFVVTLALASRADAATIVCTPGNNTQIQGCLDEAATFGADEVVFAPGDYTIDPSLAPVRLNRGGLTLRAQNSFDPPEFRCAVGNDGRPFPRAEANIAFNVVALDGASVAPIVFEDLHFRDCYMAIFLRPAATGSSYSDVQVRGLDITNANIGIALQGVVNATVEENEVKGTERAIMVTGAPPRAEHVEVIGNELSGPALDVPIFSNLTGIETQGVNGFVSANEVKGFNRMPPNGTGGRAIVNGDFAPGSFALSITNNELIGNQNGVGVANSSQATGIIAGNEIKGSGRFGIAIVRLANGWTVGPNEFKNNNWADVFLLGPLGSSVANHGDRSINQPAGATTHDNTVIVNHKAVVQDEGVNNTVLIVED